MAVAGEERLLERLIPGRLPPAPRSKAHDQRSRRAPRNGSLVPMRTVVLDPLPGEIEELVERRRRLGLDRYDELWEGTYHMVTGPGFRHAQLDQRLAVLLEPLAQAAGLTATGPFNLGDPGDFRVPDRGLHRQSDPEAVYCSSAAMVVEIVSPGDESYEKLGFYAAHGVEEVLVLDEDRGGLQLYRLAGGHYDDEERSLLLDVLVAHDHTHPPARAGS